MFYRDILGLDLAMDVVAFVRMHPSNAKMAVLVSFASQGGSGTPVPELSVEVDDLAKTMKRIQDAGIPIEYGPISEPWGVR